MIKFSEEKGEEEEEQEEEEWKGRGKIEYFSSSTNFVLKKKV